MSSTYETLFQAECTSCENQEDKSAYWAPGLYYQFANGSFLEVPHDGSVLYYLGRGDNQTFTPFPQEFRMLSGDAGARSYDNITMTFSDTKHSGRPIADRISWLCITDPPSAETPGINNTNCPFGLRLQIHFQSCWNGVDLYKTDQSHVTYLSGINEGICPPSHPFNLPQLFIETLYPVNDMPKEVGGRFVLSNGDLTGYGYHADFQNGWNETVFRAAIDQCLNLTSNINGVIDDCAPLAVDLVKNWGQRCPPRMSPINEVYTGLLDKLPGCNRVTAGPNRATSADLNCPASVIPPSIIPTQDSIPIKWKPTIPEQSGGLDGWVYVGCGNDTKRTGRALLGPSTASANMTWEYCQSFCHTKGHRYAGLEYYSECYCDNYVNNNPTWNQTHCEAPCTGAKDEMCGDAGKIMIFRNQNPGYVPPKVSYEQSVGKYSHKGCFYDDVASRALRGYSFASPDMTPSICIKKCLGRKFRYAGVQYG